MTMIDESVHLERETTHIFSRILIIRKKHKQKYVVSSVYSKYIFTVQNLKSNHMN